MQFYSIAFILFLAAALVVYYAVGKLAGKGQWIVLLVASLAFYAYSGLDHFLFIGLTAITTWAAGIAFARINAQVKEARKATESRDEKKAIKQRGTNRKRVVLAATLLLNFGVLAYIKYATTLVGYIAPDSGWSAGILLPLGISFYTFQSISYVIDTYNGKYDPERNFAKYLLFVSFFPQLIQGPINRFDALAHQLYERHAFDSTNARSALLQIGYGLMKKCAIANILLKALDPILNHIDPGMPGSVIVAGILMYAIYQYADFSGGIDMVLGFSRLFGIEMAANFRQPYFSISLGDFWRRWHITLGAWMRDYVFYPFALLPGVQRWGKWLTAHCGKHIGRTLPACVANILVFFIVGLWHGAESHFILWGLYNGIVIAASDLLTPVWDKLNKLFHVNMEGKVHHVWCIVRTFIVVNIGWYFDRIEGVQNLATSFYNTVFNFQSDLFMSTFKSFVEAQTRMGLYMVAVCCIVLFVVSVLRERGIDVNKKVLGLPFVLRGVIYAFLIVATASSYMFASTGGFMYANF